MGMLLRKRDYLFPIKLQMIFKSDQVSFSLTQWTSDLTAEVTLLPSVSLEDMEVADAFADPLQETIQGRSHCRQSSSIAHFIEIKTRRVSKSVSLTFRCVCHTVHCARSVRLCLRECLYQCTLLVTQFTRHFYLKMDIVITLSV